MRNIRWSLRFYQILLSKITSAEGVEGYGKLFASRFNKLKQIMSDRPESKKVKDIESVKSITKNDDELFVWGLVSDRKSDRNITKITLEDPTGSMEIVVFEGDLKDTADTLLMDQFAMFKNSSCQKWRIFCKRDLSSRYTRTYYKSLKN